MQLFKSLASDGNIVCLDDEHTYRHLRDLAHAFLVKLAPLLRAELPPFREDLLEALSKHRRGCLEVEFIHYIFQIKQAAE